VRRVGQERLEEFKRHQIIFDRLRAADSDDEVAAAWIVLDLLRRIYQAPDRDSVHRRLVAFYEWAVTIDVAETTRLATAIDTWQHEVLAFFDTRASNAATESANVRIKSIRRAARGFRNTGNYAARIKLSTPTSHVASRQHEDQVLHPHHRGVTHLRGEAQRPHMSTLAQEARPTRTCHSGPVQFRPTSDALSDRQLPQIAVTCPVSANSRT
jgi:hypothetical protein